MNNKSSNQPLKYREYLIWNQKTTETKEKDNPIIISHFTKKGVNDTIQDIKEG